MSIRRAFRDVSRRHSARRAFGDAAGTPANDNGGLPEWDLSRLYKGLDDKKLARDMRRVDVLTDKFVKEYEGTVAWMSGEELGNAIAEYEKIEEQRGRITRYLGLLEMQSIHNVSRTGAAQKWAEQAGARTMFFEEGIQELKESDLMTKMMSPELARYAPWLAAVRAGNRHPMPEGLDDTQSGYADNLAAWRRFYSETIADMTVMHRGRAKSFNALQDKMGEGTMEEKERDATRALLGAEMKRQADTFAMIYNAITGDGLIDAQRRGYTRPDQEVNNQNNLDNETVDLMFDTVKASYARLSHRYYRWRAGQMALEKIPAADVRAALPEEETRRYSFDEARRTVLRAFRRFSPRFARIAEKIFREGHVDAAPRDGKTPGAYAAPVGPSSLPYIILTHSGKAESVADTLGHEIGHGVHYALVEKSRGYFMSDVSTPLAETASVFAEMLVFDELLRQARTPGEQKGLRAARVENMLSTCLQQLSYYDFEKRVHDKRKDGELTAEEISDIWVDTQREYYGPAVADGDDYDRYYWTQVPHFFDTPFYVYSYALAQQLVSGLYRCYKEAEAEGDDARAAFVENYMTLLESGTTKNLYETFRPFDLDPETPAFWEAGLDLMEKYIDELETPPAPARAPKKTAKKNARRHSR